MKSTRIKHIGAVLSRSMTEEHSNETLKVERGRSRQRCLELSKKKRGKRRRSGSEDGKIKIGNTRTVGFCSYCRPSLANRIINKTLVETHFKGEMQDISRHSRESFTEKALAKRERRQEHRFFAHNMRMEMTSNSVVVEEDCLNIADAPPAMSRSQSVSSVGSSCCFVLLGQHESDDDNEGTTTTSLLLSAAGAANDGISSDMSDNNDEEEEGDDGSVSSDFTYSSWEEI
jgi:hypothetical protein